MTRHLLADPADFWYGGDLHPLGHGQIALEVAEAGGEVAEFRLDAGMQHRSDSKLLEVRDLPQGLALANRAGWLSPAAFEVSYAQAAEELLGLRPPARAVSLRKLLVEMHLVLGLSWRLAAYADLLGRDASEWLRWRELWSQAGERLTGARLHDAYVRIGGVAADAPTDFADSLGEIPTAPTIDASAWQGRAVFDGKDAMTRVQDCTAQLARAQQTALDLASTLPDGGISSLLPKHLRLPVGQAFSSTAGANGDCAVWLHSDGGKTALRVHLQSQVAQTSVALEQATIGRNLEDARLLLHTLPLSAGELAL